MRLPLTFFSLSLACITSHAQAAQPILRAKAAEFLAALEQPGIDGDHPDALAAYGKLVYK
jgi:hypothetical protein